MNVDLQNLLTSRADSAELATFDPHDVMVQGGRRMRRRNRFAVAGATLAVAVTVGVYGVLVDHSREQPAPANRDDGDALTWSPGTRPITYGQKHTLHLGEREIDTELDVLSLDITDDGAALTTIDGGIWFTDGRTIERIGNTLGGRVRPNAVSWRTTGPAEWVVSDTEGSLLAWLDYAGQQRGRPELVVYDSTARTVLARVPFDVAGRNGSKVLAMAGREVFVAETDRHTIGEVVSVLRYDVDARLLESVDEAYVESALRGVERAMVIGLSADGGTLVDWDADSFDDRSEVSVRNSRLAGLFDARTDEPLELRVPTKYNGRALSFVQLLDDDRFTLISHSSWAGDLLVCQIAEGQCEVAIDEATWPTLRTVPLLPGEGGVGANVALARALGAHWD